MPGGSLLGVSLRVRRDDVLLLMVIIVLPSSPEEGEPQTGRFRLLLLDPGELNKSELMSGSGDSATKPPEKGLAPPPSDAIFSWKEGLCSEGMDPIAEARLARGFLRSRS